MNTDSKIIDVVSAVRQSNNLYWMCRRSKTQKHAGLWEFPGGKVEPGESLIEALVREMREEFDIGHFPDKIRIGEVLAVIPSYTTDFKTCYRVHFIEVEFNATYTLKEHDATMWSSPEHLCILPQLSSGKEFLKLIISNNIPKEIITYNPDCDFCNSKQLPAFRYFGNHRILCHSMVADNGNETEYYKCPFKEYIGE